jgi:hypothetical protein
MIGFGQITFSCGDSVIGYHDNSAIYMGGEIGAFDFNVNPGENFQITNITLTFWLSSPTNYLTSSTMNYYSDSNGSPGQLLGYQTITPYSSVSLGQSTLSGWYGYEITANINPITFYGQSGINTKYWIGGTNFYNNNNTSNSLAIEITNTNVSGDYCYVSIDGGLTWSEQVGSEYAYRISGNCITTPGCTDSTALNYDPTATIDDSSCVYCSLIINSTVVANATCFEVCDGSIMLNVSGGVPASSGAAYTYLWDDALSQTANPAIGLCAGTYTCTVTDMAGCSVISNSILVSEPNEFIANIILDSAILCNGETGDLSVTVTGGTNTADSIWWSDGTTQSNSLNNVIAGNYSVFVKDDNGCSDTAHYNLDEPSVITILGVETLDVKCKGDSLGETYIQATGGVPIPGIPSKYNYELFDVDGILINQQLAWEAQFTGLSTGNYYVVVTDNNGCADTTGIIFIDEPNNDLEITINSYDETAMLNDGYAVVYPTGGTPTYTFIWDNGSTNQSNGINNSYQQILTAGANTFHTIIVNDANGCEVSDSIIINAYNPTGLLNIKNINKELLKVTNLLGRETKGTKNQPLFYIYDDGTVEKRIIIE